MEPALIRFAAIPAGALCLAWPALYNGYPLLFSDTGALLDSGLTGVLGWDKPFVYGPLIAAFSLRQTLFLPVAVQALLLASLLWTLLATTPSRYLLLCVLLAVATPAPFVTATILPDALTPVAVLAILTSTLGPARWRTPAAIVAAIAIAAHLSHLVIAAALIAALTLLRRRLPWRPLASLAAALLTLLAINWIGRGQPAISPYGSVFALARLIADGPARLYLAETCPASGYALCRWQDQLTDDSDQFLWDARSPFWADPLPLPAFAREAGAIVSATIRTYPGAVLRDALRNTARQLVRLDLGDTLGPDFLDTFVRPVIAIGFPPAELARYDASRQHAGGLAELSARLNPLDRAVSVLAALSAAAFLAAGLRRPNPRADLAACLLVALAANAFTGGALSTVHDRYQARLAWVLLLPAFLSSPRQPASDRTSAS